MTIMLLMSKCDDLIEVPKDYRKYWSIKTLKSSKVVFQQQNYSFCKIEHVNEKYGILMVKFMEIALLFAFPILPKEL